jgi:hypothetical protein
MNKYGFHSDLLNECIDNCDVFLKRVNGAGGDRDKEKTQVIAVINGASYPNNKVLHQLSFEIKGCIDYVINLPEYKDVYDYVKKNYDKNIEGKTISRILQIIENDLLESYVEWSNSKGFIENGSISLIFDGFQLLKKHNITDELLEECRKNTYDKTGYDIQLKIKPFDNPLTLPDDYNEFNDIVTSLLDKFSVGIELFVENNLKYIEEVVKNGGSHLEISTLGHKLFKNWTYYDSKRESWFYCDLNNIWCEAKKTFILKHLIQIILCKVCVIYAKSVSKELWSENIEEGKKKLLEE